MTYRAPDDRRLSTEEVRTLMKEINKRMIIFGLGAVAVGLVVIGLVWLFS